MFWYIDRDSDAILITSEKWRKSLIRTRHRNKKKENKIGGEDTSLFCFSWSFSWSGYSGLYFWIIVFRVKVCPSQAAWSGTLLSIGEWTDITKYLKSDLSSVLEAVHVYIKNLKPCLAWSSNVVYATNVYNATCL